MKYPRCPHCGEELGNPMTSHEIPGIPPGKVQWTCSECPSYRAFQYLPWTAEFDKYYNSDPGGKVTNIFVMLSVGFLAVVLMGVFFFIRWLFF